MNLTQDWGSFHYRCQLWCAALRYDARHTLLVVWYFEACSQVIDHIVHNLFSRRDLKDAEVKSMRKTAEKLREEVEHLRKQLTSEKYERYAIT